MKDDAPSADSKLSRRAFVVGGLAAGAGLVVPASRVVAATPRTVDLICRSAWGAKPPTGTFVRHTIHRLTIHHSGVVFWDNRQAPARFRDEQAYHQSLGWPDIAYHILIDRHGNVYHGRPFWARGNTRTDYDPTGHLLFMCEGNFEKQRIPDAQVGALVDALAWGAARYQVPLYRIKGHRDYAATACPGKYLYALIENGTVRRRVRRRLDAGGVNFSKLCGPAGKKRVQQIVNGTR